MLAVKLSSFKQQTFITSKFLLVRDPDLDFLGLQLRFCHKAAKCSLGPHLKTLLGQDLLLGLLSGCGQDV